MDGEAGWWTTSGNIVLSPLARVMGEGRQQQHDKGTLLLTYNALWKYIASYAAPVWNTNASDSSFKKIQTAQNAALWTATWAHKMASIYHLQQQQHDKGTLLLTYNALWKYIASYAAPVWNTNASDSSFKKIQTAQNAALWTATWAHKMASIYHLHQSLTLRVKDHSDMLSAQYLVNCLEEDHVNYGITIQEPRPRPMKETLHSRHHSTVLPRLGSSRMESHHNLHTHAVDSDIQLQGHNRVLKKRPPPI